MNADRWREVRAVFDELVELDANRRAERLAILGTQDPQLCEAVESLLASDATSSGDLGGAALPPRGDRSGPSADPLGLAGRTLSFRTSMCWTRSKPAEWAWSTAPRTPAWADPSR